MTTITLYNRSGKSVGYADTQQSSYSRVIDYRKGQMFMAPKWQGSIAISLDILEKLVQLKIRTIRFLIVGFEDRSFLAVMSMKDFLRKSKDIFFEGKTNSDPQKACPIHEFTRIYDYAKQELLLR